MAIVAGAKPGDYNWAGTSGPFTWIAADNSFHLMDAITVVNFARQIAVMRSQMTFAARAMKNALAAGQDIDIYADKNWGVDPTSPTSTYLADPSGEPTPIGQTSTDVYTLKLFRKTGLDWSTYTN